MYGKAVQNGLLNYATANDTSVYKEVNLWGDFIDNYGTYIEKNGNDVDCTQAYVTKDGEVSLYNCSTKESKKMEKYYSIVNGKVSEYKPRAYKISKNDDDAITYKGYKWYVIEDSGIDQDYVKLLKADPLTVKEIDTYGIGEDGIKHVNQFTADLVGKAYDIVGDGSVGGVAWYTSATCRTGSESGCKSEYNESEIKYIIDNWSNSKLDMNELKEVDGYKIKLINNSEYANINNTAYIWRYNTNYNYWGMDTHHTSKYAVSKGGTYHYQYDAQLFSTYRYNDVAIRPVINFYKYAIKN